MPAFYVVDLRQRGAVGGQDMKNDTIRECVAAVDREVTRLSAEATTGIVAKTIADLIASWSQLVKVMALGPEPELRECPVCRHTGMRAATLCGYCWTNLLPLAPAPTPI